MEFSGGRLWDVRFATKKSGADPSSWVASSDAEGTAPAAETEEASASDAASEVTTEESPKGGESVLVCRPRSVSASRAAASWESGAYRGFHSLTCHSVYMENITIPVTYSFCILLHI